jgi:uncharacterized RDD family membrane protein YckC
MASSDHEQRSGLAGAAGRAAFFSARTAARAWRDEFESAVDEVLSAPEIARLVDSALAGPLPDEIARSIVRHRVIDRVVAELASSGELDRLLSAALASPRALEFTDRVLASDATRHALREVASSPEVRDAIFRQTTGLFEDVLGIVRSSAVRLDDSVERPVRRGERPERTVCAGIVTRALALAVDVAATIGIHLLLVAVVALVASLVGGLRPQWLVGMLLGLGWILIAGGYFVLFWSTTGQTPGMRLFRLRVHSRGAVPSVGRSIVRMVGLVLAIAPFFLGFVPVLFDERRRGLPDFLAGTVVEYEDEQGS